MRIFVTFLCIAAVAFISGGCTRTYISTGDPGIPSPAGDTRLCLTAHGAYGRAYGDRTGKLLDICIKRGAPTNETILFLHKYRFVGADLWGAVEWNSTNAVTVQVYDSGNGVSKYEARARAAPSNHIATLSFLMDKQTGKFKEIRGSGIREFTAHLGISPLFIVFMVLCVGMAGYCSWLIFREFRALFKR
jgi:hypothetical protein